LTPHFQPRIFCTPKKQNWYCGPIQCRSWFGLEPKFNSSSPVPTSKRSRSASVWDNRITDERRT
jgi:hypothetical protein